MRCLRQIMRSLKHDTQREMLPLQELTNGDLVLTLRDTVLFRSRESALRSGVRPFIQAISEVLIERDRHVCVDRNRLRETTQNGTGRIATFATNRIFLL